KHTYLTTKQIYSPKDLLQQNKHTYLKTCQSGTTVLVGQDHVHHMILIFPHVHHKTLRSSHLQDKKIINTTGHTPKWQLHHIKDNLSNTTNRQPNNLDKNRMIHLIANNKLNNLTQDKLASHKTLRSSHLQDKQIINTTGHTPEWQLHHIKDNLSNITNRQPNNLDKTRMSHLIANKKHKHLSEDTQETQEKPESHKTLTHNSAKMFALCTKQ